MLNQNSRPLPDWLTRAAQPRMAYPLLLALGLLFFLPGFFTLPPIDRDEARFAQASKQMVESGDYLDIRVQDTPRYKKPIGIYWLQAASVQLFSPDQLNVIWPYRVPSLFGALAAVLLTYALGRHLLRAEVGLLAAWFLLAAPLLHMEARLAKTDAMLLTCTLWAQLALVKMWFAPKKMNDAPQTLTLPLSGDSREEMWEGRNANSVSGRGDMAEMFPYPKLLRNFGPPIAGIVKDIVWPLQFWLALALGVLIKGPMIVLVTGLTIAGSLWLMPQARGQRRGMIKQLKPLAGLALLVALVAPWLIAITIKSHGAFWLESVGHDLLGKVAHGQEDHGAWPGYYLLLLPLLGGASFLFFVYALPLIRTSRQQAPMVFLLCWLLPSWLIFECIPTKLPHYILPLLPALCLLAAWRIAQAPMQRRRWHWPFLWLTLLISVLLWTAGSVAALGLQVGLLFAPFLLLLLMLPLAVHIWVQRRGFILLLLLNIAALLMVLIRAPGLPDFWLSQQLADWKRAEHVADRDIIITGYGEVSAVFLLGTHVQNVNGADEAWKRFQDQPHAVLIAADHGNDRETKPSSADVVRSEAAKDDIILKPAATLRGFNLGRGKVQQLQVYRHAE